MDSALVFPAVFAAMVVFFLVATKLSRAGRLSPALQTMTGKSVEVRVWGTDLPAVRVHSVRAFGAGLLFFLEPASGGKPVLLKVAQPQSARHDELGIVISDARYVQWRGARIPRAVGQSALELTVTSADHPK